MPIKLKMHKSYRGAKVLAFHCLGCKYDHAFHVEGDPNIHAQWTWNGSMDKPTFTPSLLCNKDHAASRCHSFVTDGKIQYLADCWHELAGKTIDLPDYEED